MFLRLRLKARKTNKKGREQALPKSWNHLIEKVATTENIYTAVINATQDKNTDTKTNKIALYMRQNIDKVVANIKRMIENQEFTARKHAANSILDMSSKKVRLILKPDLEDEQVIHWACIQQLQDIFMRGMYEYSFGSIPGRGPELGRKSIEKFIRRHPADFKYVLEFDIKKFYPSINTEILKKKLRRIIHDEKMMFLLEQIIDSNVAIYPDGHEERVGVPIGYYTSQWFGNFYLQELDHYIKEKLHAKGMFRYVDNVEIFGRNKKELHKMLEEIKVELAKLGLRMKENYQIYRFDYIDKKDGKRKGRPMDFMGFRFYRDKTTLRRSRMMKTTRKARKIHKKNLKNKPVTWYDSCQMMSLLGPFRKTDTYNVFQKHIKPFVNIKNCRQRIRTRQLKINEAKEKNQCLNSEKQKVLKSQSDSTKQVPQTEFTSESTVQLKLFQITTEMSK